MINPKEIKLKDNFFQYQFPPDEGRDLGQNVFVLYHKDECIIFDPGYERHIESILHKFDGLRIKYVICTHFHPDHCYGLNILGKQHVIGSHLAINTLKYFEDDENELLLPTTKINDPKEVLFHGHVIKLRTNMGHSNCGILIDIDGKFLLTGDEFMTTNDNIPVLPYVAESVSNHKKALEYIINNYKGYTYLPSHGVKTSKASDLKYRVSYLDFVITGEKDIDKFYTKSSIRFLSEKWHKLNLDKEI